MKINNLTFGMLLSILWIVTITTLLNSIYGQEENMKGTEDPKFLAIQHAQSGTISKINDTTSTLELNDVSKKTILFSDRPERIVKTERTTNFIGNWSARADSFAVDAPNAVLVVDESEKQDDVIVDLFNPVYDSDKKALKYEIIPDNATSISLPKEFGQSTLIIDPGGQPGLGG